MTPVRSKVVETVVSITFLLVSAAGAFASEAGSGVRIIEFDPPEGRIRVFLPDDMAAGDTVSASIRVYPEGSTDDRKRAGSSALGGYYVETSYFSVRAAEGSVKFQVPRNSAGSSILFTLRDQSRVKHGSARIPVGVSAARRLRDGQPTPFDYQCPLVGQAGGMIEIKGPFDGDFATTEFKVGDKNPALLAESPRKLVFESPQDIVGSVELVLREREVVVTRPYTCLRVVKIDEKGAVPVSGSAADSAAVVDMSAAGEEALPQGTTTLEFQGIKTEETLRERAPGGEPAFDEPPRGKPDDASAYTEAPAAEDSGDPGKEIILARQMEAPIHSRPQGRSLRPSSRPDSGAATAAPAAASDAALPALPVETALKAGILDNQMLALHTERGAASAADNEHPASGVSRPAPGGVFSVQVASTRRPEDAESLASVLRKKGYGAYVVQAEVAGKGRWYRVRVGSFANRREAGTFADLLKKKEPLVKAAFVAENE